MAGRRALGSHKSSVEPALFNHNPLLQRIFLYAAGHWPKAWWMGWPEIEGQTTFARLP